MTDESGAPLFVVAQQLRFGYELHAFESEQQFRTWAKVNTTPGMRKPADAHGKLVSRKPIDHRFDPVVE